MEVINVKPKREVLPTQALVAAHSKSLLPFSFIRRLFHIQGST
ncbi:6016_t:CDS:2 [Funneliformis mosseae]|uniref:6016_t:CDS:1 n=1 Tax=Funneliformis mosseae TaxID=27381 RepID=A0A9N9DHP7_FUNMO|nr:6016_t:CDS:2 [Funneliformis mosseae]